MRIAAELLLSTYARSAISLEHLRQRVEDIDWDDPAMPLDERRCFLHVEALLAGIDEGYNDEGDLKSFLARSVRIWLNVPGDDDAAVVSVGANNAAVPLDFSWMSPAGITLGPPVHPTS